MRAPGGPDLVLLGVVNWIESNGFLVASEGNLQLKKQISHYFSFFVKIEGPFKMQW